MRLLHTGRVTLLPLGCMLTLCCSPVSAQVDGVQKVIQANKRVSQISPSFYTQVKLRATKSPALVEALKGVHKRNGRHELVAGVQRVSPALVAVYAGEEQKRIEQFFDPQTNTPLSPLEFSDGKRLHIISNAVVSQDHVVSLNKNNADTTVKRSGTSSLDPLSVTYKIDGVWLWQLLEEKKFKVTKTAYSPQDEFVTLSGKYRSAPLSVTLDPAHDYAIVKSLQDNQGYISTLEVTERLKDQVPVVAKTYRHYITFKKIPLNQTQYETLAFSGTSQAGLFAEVEGLQVGKVYDQDANRTYQMRDKLARFDDERGLSRRRLFGWLFIVSLTALVVALCMAVLKWKQKRLA